MTKPKRAERPARPPRARLEPLDPDSPAGRAASAALTEVLGDALDRMRREGVPIPDLYAPENAQSTRKPKTQRETS